MGHVGSTGFDSTIVALDTDEGITGWGEMAVISALYADSFAAGARAGIADLAPLLLGADPTQPTHRAGAARRSDARAAVRQVGARHGLLGRAARTAGGRCARCSVRATARRAALQRRHRLPLERQSHSPGSSSRRVRRLQVKIGTEPEADAERLAAVRAAVGDEIVLFADANGAFTSRRGTALPACDARSRVRLSSSRAAPTPSAPPCAAPPTVRWSSTSRSSRSTTSCARTAKASRTGHVKLQRVGGITRALLLRDVAVELGPRGDGRGRGRCEPRHRGRRARRSRHTRAAPRAHVRLPPVGLRRSRHRPPPRADGAQGPPPGMASESWSTSRRWVSPCSTSSPPAELTRRMARPSRRTHVEDARESGEDGALARPRRRRPNAARSDTARSRTRFRPMRFSAPTRSRISTSRR